MLGVLERGWEQIHQLPINPTADEVRHYVNQLEGIRREFECETLHARICRAEQQADDSEHVTAVLQAAPKNERRSVLTVVVRAEVTRWPRQADMGGRYEFTHFSIGAIPRVQGRVTVQGHGLDITTTTYVSQPNELATPMRHRIPDLPVNWWSMLRATVWAEICDYRLEQLRQTL